MARDRARYTDLRASFITFLKSEHNDQELLKSAAIAMRHTTQMQVRQHNPDT